MPSPQRAPKGSPPKRAALHEKTDSQTNERSLRMIGGPQAPIYGTPFPTKPSQILSPRGYSGSTVGAELGVSDDGNALGETIGHIGDSQSLSTQQGSSRSPGPIHEDDGPSPRRTSTDASFRTAQTISPSKKMANTSSTLEDPLEEDGRMSDDIVQLPSVPFKSVLPKAYSQNSSDPFGRQPVQTKDSGSSLSSSSSSGTVIVNRNRDGSSRSTPNQFTSQKSTAADMTAQQPPVSPVSPSSPVSISFTTPTERRTSSSPIYGNLQTTSQSLVNLQYPVIRPPSASASWAETPSSTPEGHQRILERNQDRWNPHLSTVQSEGTGSPSEGRSSQSIRLLDSTRVSKSSSMVLNDRRSSDLPMIPSPAPLGRNPGTPDFPNHAPEQTRDLSGSTIRVVREREDHLPTLQPIPGSRDSAYLGVPSAFGEHGNSLITRRGSNMSFFRDSIPAWAKAYYARPHSSSSFLKSGRGSRPSTSTDNTSLNMFRPRTRNNREPDGQPRRNSLEIEPLRPGVPDLREVRGPSRHRMSPQWSPHLWHDRTSLGRRRSIFQAPNIDEQAEGKALNKRNAQIGLFVLGFIFPFGWFVASFLPLPPRPEISSVKGKDNPNRTHLAEDIEKHLDPIDEARYENARWWRNINRIMSLVGIVIVVAVITIAAASA